MEHSSEVDFSVGFNDADFSDRVLRLEITRPPSKLLSKLGKYFNYKVKTLNICSLILAAKSPFFYKLFKNGMKESLRRENGGVTVRIHHSEEAAFMDLLSFIYDKPMKGTSEAELFKVLMAADKFEVPSCVKHCHELLLKFPLTVESAIHYIEHSSIAFLPLIDPLVDVAKRFLAANFRDFNKSQQDAAMELPLLALEVVLGSNGLRVDSEDIIFDFTLRWARKHYQNLQERREIMTNRVASLIYFQNMSCSKLKTNLVCPDFDQERISELVMNALFSKVEGSDGGATFPRRVYNNRLVKVIYLRPDQLRCVVYFDLAKEVCADLAPLKCLNSQTFCFGGETFLLFARREKPEKDTLGVYVRRMGGSTTCTLSIHLLAMNKLSKQFISLLGKFVQVYERDQSWGLRDAFKTPWKKLMEDESEYFIDGILHLQADITFVK